MLALLFASCNPFITKELRRKNKCNRKLKRVVNRCPDLLKQDTIIAIYDTTIITKGSKIDTVIYFDFDTITLFKDKLRLKLIKTIDTLLVDGECIPDTIRIKERVEVPVSIASMINLTVWERISNWLKDIWWILVLFAALVIGIRFVWRSLFQKTQN